MGGQHAEVSVGGTAYDTVLRTNDLRRRWMQLTQTEVWCVDYLLSVFFFCGSRGEIHYSLVSTIGGPIYSPFSYIYVFSLFLCSTCCVLLVLFVCDM